MSEGTTVSLIEKCCKICFGTFYHILKASGVEIGFPVGGSGSEEY